jgi:hypothetical protein
LVYNVPKTKKGVFTLENFIVLTNKDTFQTILDNPGLEPIETYHFYFFEELKAKYTIAKVVDESAKITLYESYEGKEYVNNIHIKFFERFETLDGAREELNEIVKASGNSEDSVHSKLVKSDKVAV